MAMLELVKSREVAGRAARAVGPDPVPRASRRRPATVSGAESSADARQAMTGRRPGRAMTRTPGHAPTTSPERRGAGSAPLRRRAPARAPRDRRALRGRRGETVDARLGDLEVSLRDRGIRLVASGERVELATAPEAGAPDRPLRRCRRRPSLAGVPGDARDRRLPPADHPRRHRADPRRRLGLRAAQPDASPAGGGAGPRRHAGPPDPLRHGLRVHGALRADVAGRSAVAGHRAWPHASPRRAACQPAPDAQDDRPGMTEGVRIQKALADAGIASRRAAEQLVSRGASR